MMMVLIKGAGDLATGTAIRLYRAGFSIVMTDLPFPTAVRTTVSFSEAIRKGHARVEDVEAVRADSLANVSTILESNKIAVLTDPDAACRTQLRPWIVIDAILAKRNLNTSIGDAETVIALGPGFTAGVDCHAVVETMRGHDLGRVYYHGSAAPNTGIPGEIGGYSLERVLRAPCDGVFEPIRKITDIVAPGDVIATVNGVPMKTEIAGVLRGLLPEGTRVTAGMKSGDVDPRCKPIHCFSCSDKARAIAGGALEAILHLNPTIVKG